MPRYSKRKIDVQAAIKCINLNNRLMDGILDLGRDELASVLAHIANIKAIPTAAFKKARSALPYFPTVKWTDFAPKYGLPKDPDQIHADLATYSTPRYRLPPAFHKNMFQNAWHWQDVYRETIDQTREQATLRILEPHTVPIIALFQGRVLDKPEQVMEETAYSMGDEVEHKIFMIGSVLFLIIESKPNCAHADALAQLFLALLSADDENTMINCPLRVYGLLTNDLSFSFYSYDPIEEEFCFDECIPTTHHERPGSLARMADVSNKIFGLILSAYIDSLRVNIEKSKKINDVSPPGSSSEEMEAGGPSPGSELTRGLGGSPEDWQAALNFAQACCEKFNEPVASLEDIEKNKNDALALLFRSVHSIPRASSFTGKDDEDSTPSQLKDLADRVIDEMYQTSLST